jgi:hypothetical protein
MNAKEKEIPKPRNFVKEKKSKHEIAAPEFDLHRKVSAQQTRNVDDILTLQTETAKRHIEFAIRNRIPKIFFIHGVGRNLKSRVGFLIVVMIISLFKKVIIKNMVKVQQKFYQTKCDVNQISRLVTKKV